MIKLSLALNILVLLPVCAGLVADADWVTESFGAFTAARGILLAVYLAIGLLSAFLLHANEPKMVAALLLAQVIYKLLTPVTVGTLFNPVVVSNLFIAAFHAATLALIFRDGKKGMLLEG
jgi:hypothetical protein